MVIKLEVSGLRRPLPVDSLARRQAANVSRHCPVSYRPNSHTASRQSDPTVHGRGPSDSGESRRFAGHISGLTRSTTRTAVLRGAAAAEGNETQAEFLLSSSNAASRIVLTGAEDDGEELDLRECRHFVNLTNGIEALPMLEELQLPYSFVRIQSTACEQQNLEALVAELDANLLVNLAMGHCCLVYDCGSRGRDGTPRALWYGLEFVRYTLSKLWLRRPCPALLRGKNVARQFDQHIRAFRQSTTRRLQYYSKYLPPGTGTGDPDVAAAADVGEARGAAGAGLRRLRLYGVCRPTDHDHDSAHFVRLLHRHHLPARFAVAAAAELPRATSPAEEQLAAGVGSRREQGGGHGEEGHVEGHREEGHVERQGAVQSIERSTEPPGDAVGGAQDGEAVLARFGFRLFRRGLSPAEWTARAAAMSSASSGSEEGL